MVFWVGQILQVANVCKLAYLLTYLLAPRSGVLLEKLTGPQLVKKFPAFYGTGRFITAFTSARHPSLSWARSIQSMPSHPTSWRSILILSSHLRLGLQSGFSPRSLHQRPVYTSTLPHTCCMPPTSFFSSWSPQKIISEECKSLTSSLCSFLHSLVTSSVTTYKNTRCQIAECKNLNRCLLSFWRSQQTLIKTEI